MKVVLKLLPFLSTAFERFSECQQPPVCPSEVQRRRVTAESFPLFVLSPMKTSQEARGLARCGDTIGVGGVTGKPADRSLDTIILPIAHPGVSLCPQCQYILSHCY